MNKQKGIIMGILALAVTMMVGYALFSETITINGTATAKGNFNVDFACELMTEDFDLGDGGGLRGTTGGTGTCSIEGNTIKTTSTLNKPDDIVSYKVTLTNNGSIPAILKTVDSSNNVSEDIISAGDYAYFDMATYMLSNYTFYKNGMTFSTGNNIIAGDSLVENENIILQPQETLVMFIANVWMVDEVQPKLPEEGTKWNYNVTLGFEQTQAQ